MSGSGETIVLPPRIETTKPMLLAGLVDRYECKAPMGIPALWQRFGPYIGSLPGQKEKVAYGVSYNFDPNMVFFDYMAGVEVSNAAGLPSEIKTLEIPAQRYAMFTHPGHIATIRDAFAAIWRDWFPTSGEIAANAPTVERYGPEYNPATGNGGFEIWVPIQG